MDKTRLSAFLEKVLEKWQNICYNKIGIYVVV